MFRKEVCEWLLVFDLHQNTLFCYLITFVHYLNQEDNIVWSY